MRKSNYWEIKGNIVFQGSFYDKQELNGEVFAVAKHVLQMKEKPSIAAIYMERSEWLITVMWAFLKAGIPFVPLDITIPAGRRVWMMKRLSVSFVVTQEKFRPLFPDANILTTEMLYESGIEHMDGAFSDFCDENSVAYEIFTSGTTGVPKAVQISQKALRSFASAISMVIPLQKEQRISSFTTASFDIFFLETIVALRLGLTVILATEQERGNPKLMKRVLIDQNVQVVQLTPSHLRTLGTYDRQFEAFKKVEILLVGGEMFPKSLLKELQEKTKCRIFNLYGPTEATIWASGAELTNAEDVCIGTPFSNAVFCVLDENGNEVPEGVCGEICIGGEGLADGYFGEQELTEEKFFTCGFDKTHRLYHTGDIGRRRAGEYECLGRSDNQIKYMGHRIELEEIESVCDQLPGMIRSQTCFEKCESGDSLVLLYESEENLSVNEVQKWLKKRLPHYMMPKYYFPVSELFLTENGKLNRKKNYEAYVKIPEAGQMEYTKSLQPLTEAVTEIVQSQAPQVCVHEDTRMEELQMDSLDFIRLVVELEEQFAVAFADEYCSSESFDTVKDLCEYIQKAKHVCRGE